MIIGKNILKCFFLTVQKNYKPAMTSALNSKFKDLIH